MRYLVPRQNGQEIEPTPEQPESLCDAAWHFPQGTKKQKDDAETHGAARFMRPAPFPRIAINP
jgi:hypothetical protein